MEESINNSTWGPSHYLFLLLLSDVSKHDIYFDADKINDFLKFFQAQIIYEINELSYTKTLFPVIYAYTITYMIIFEFSMVFKYLSHIHIPRITKKKHSFSAVNKSSLNVLFRGTVCSQSTETTQSRFQIISATKITNWMTQ